MSAIKYTVLLGSENRFGETVATARHENVWINSVEWNLIDRIFFQPMKILHHTHHTPPIMLPAFYLLFYKIHYRNSWIINNLNSSQAKIQRRCKNIQPYYILKCLRPSSNVAFLLRRIQCKWAKTIVWANLHWIRRDRNATFELGLIRYLYIYVSYSVSYYIQF